MANCSAKRSPFQLLEGVKAKKKRYGRAAKMRIKRLGQYCRRKAVKVFLQSRIVVLQGRELHLASHPRDLLLSYQVCRNTKYRHHQFPLFTRTARFTTTTNGQVHCNPHPGQVHCNPHHGQERREVVRSLFDDKSLSRTHRGNRAPQVSLHNPRPNQLSKPLPLALL